MTRRNPLAALARAAVGAVLLAGPLSAQASIEAGAGLTVGNFGGAYSRGDFRPGPGARLTVAYDLDSRLGLYIGYDRGAFGCETGFCQDADTRYVSAGPVLGARLAPGPDHPVWAQVETGWHALRASWRHPGESGRATADRASSWALAVGFHAPVRGGLRIGPALRARTYRAAFVEGSAPHRVHTATIELGGRWTR